MELFRQAVEREFSAEAVQEHPDMLPVVLLKHDVSPPSYVQCICSFVHQCNFPNGSTK
jgi:hypothetical protein